MRSPPPLFKGSGGLATACRKNTTHQREKPERRSVYVFLCELCTCVFTCSSYMRASIYISACVLAVRIRAARLRMGTYVLRVSLETEEGGEEVCVEDGNKIRLFIGLEWEQVA